MKVASFWLSCLVLALCGLLAAPGFGQETPPAGGGQGGASGRGGPGGRGNFMQMMADRVKTALGATDDEWKAIQPKLEKVTTAQMEARLGGRGGMFGSRGSRRGGQGGAQTAPAADAPPLSPLAQASKDLQTALDNKDSTPEQIKAKLEALRAARAKAQEALKAAQKDLTEILTQRQEAVLVGMGLLD